MEDLMFQVKLLTGVISVQLLCIGLVLVKIKQEENTLWSQVCKVKKEKEVKKIFIG